MTEDTQMLEYRKGERNLLVLGHESFYTILKKARAIEKILPLPHVFYEGRWTYGDLQRQQSNFSKSAISVVSVDDVHGHDLIHMQHQSVGAIFHGYDSVYGIYMNRQNVSEPFSIIAVKFHGEIQKLTAAAGA